MTPEMFETPAGQLLLKVREVDGLLRDGRVNMARMLLADVETALERAAAYRPTGEPSPADGTASSALSGPRGQDVDDREPVDDDDAPPEHQDAETEQG